MHIKMFGFIKSVVYIVLLKLICFQCNLKVPYMFVENHKGVRS